MAFHGAMRGIPDISFERQSSPASNMPTSGNEYSGCISEIVLRSVMVLDYGNNISANMDITSTLGMQTEQHLPDVDMLEEDESYLRNCEPENSHMQFAVSSGWQNSRLHAEDSIFIHMRTLMDIDPPESTHGEKLLEAHSKPGTEPKKK
ncbi:hypothetical protein GGI25_005974 [Coemansia spiralis]|uniref:Uncharacterized protein n=2 Tax=Coemansia TaxID=4863 RepID=A0A9W8KVM1_9FUNG|nr:hypothetical protein EDC05_003322 [Coemansia umbellata]KAJ2619117.1 hypothetical protein GGI26_006082 [Coemansia sp. RSA 1358]KAJ2670001.1 hypothetical protein GGI25_005974 [Coemansia spiralis]